MMGRGDTVVPVSIDYSWHGRTRGGSIDFKALIHSSFKIGLAVKLYRYSYIGIIVCVAYRINLIYNNRKITVHAAVIILYIKPYYRLCAQELSGSISRCEFYITVGRLRLISYLSCTP